MAFTGNVNKNGQATKAKSQPVVIASDQDALSVNVISSSSVVYATLIDEVSATVSYIGKAVAGSVTSDPVWQVSKLDTTTGLSLRYADGVITFNKVWDDRATYTYP